MRHSPDPFQRAPGDPMQAAIAGRATGALRHAAIPPHLVARKGAAAPAERPTSVDDLGLAAVSHRSRLVMLQPMTGGAHAC